MCNQHVNLRGRRDAIDTNGISGTIVFAELCGDLWEIRSSASNTKCNQPAERHRPTAVSTDLLRLLVGTARMPSKFASTIAGHLCARFWFIATVNASEHPLSPCTAERAGFSKFTQSLTVVVKITVAFCSAKERCFRGATGDYYYGE